MRCALFDRVFAGVYMKNLTDGSRKICMALSAGSLSRLKLSLSFALSVFLLTFCPESISAKLIQTLHFAAGAAGYSSGLTGRAPADMDIEELIIRLELINWHSSDKGVLTELRRRGPAARAAIPALLKMQDQTPLSWDLRKCISDTLLTVDPPRPSELHKLKARALSKDDSERWKAVYALGMIKMDPGFVLPSLTHALLDKDWRVRMAAEESLRKIGPPASPAVPLLVKMLDRPAPRYVTCVKLAGAVLKDSDPCSNEAYLLDVEEKEQIFVVLQAIGPAAGAAIPMLLRKVNGAAFNPAIFITLGHIGRAASVALPDLLKVFRRGAMQVRCNNNDVSGPDIFSKIYHRFMRNDDNASNCDDNDMFFTIYNDIKPSDIRVITLEAIVAINPYSPETQIALRESLQNGNPQLVEAALKAIPKVGPAAIKFIPLLEQKIPLSPVGLRLLVLPIYRAGGAAGMPALLAALNDPDSTVRIAACEMLSGMNVYAGQIVPAMEKAAKERPELSSAGAAVLVKMGKPGVVVLAKWLESKDANQRLTAAMAIRKTGLNAGIAAKALGKALEDPSEEVRSAAIETLSSMGSLAVEAVPDIVGFAKNHFDNTEPVSRLLSRIGRDGQEIALPLLLEMLKNDDRSVQRSAADIIGGLVPVNRRAVPLLIRLLDANNPSIVNAAVEALGSIGRSAKAALPALARLHKPCEVSCARKPRSRIVRVGTLGSSVYLRRSQSVKIMVHESYEECLAACGYVLDTAIANINGSTRPMATDDLAAMMSVPLVENQEGRRAVALRIHALSAYQEAGAAGISGLVGALRDDDDRVRTAASTILAGMTEYYWRIVPELEESANERPELAPSFAMLLVRMGKPGVTALTKWFESPDENQRLTAAIAIGEAGPDARIAVKPLGRLLADHSKDVHLAAVRTLARLGPLAAEAVPTIVFHSGIIFKPSKERAYLLSKIGPEASFPYLFDMLRHSNAHLRVFVMNLIADLTPDDKLAVAGLTRLLDDINPDTIRIAAETLGVIGPSAKAALPALELARKKCPETCARAQGSPVEKTGTLGHGASSKHQESSEECCAACRNTMDAAIARVSGAAAAK